MQKPIRWRKVHEAWRFVRINEVWIKGNSLNGGLVYSGTLGGTCALSQHNWQVSEVWLHGSAVHAALKPHLQAKIFAAVKSHLKAKLACNPHPNFTVKFFEFSLCQNTVLAMGNGSSSQCAATLPGRWSRHVSLRYWEHGRWHGMFELTIARAYVFELLGVFAHWNTHHFGKTPTPV